MLYSLTFQDDVHKGEFFKIHSLEFYEIWQNYYFHRISNNENSNTEVEQRNSEKQAIFSGQLYS